MSDDCQRIECITGRRVDAVDHGAEAADRRRDGLNLEPPFCEPSSPMPRSPARSPTFRVDRARLARQLLRRQHGGRPFLGSFLRKVVTRSGEHPVIVSTREFGSVMRRAWIDAIGIAVDRNGWNGDRRLRGEPGLDVRVAPVPAASRGDEDSAISLPVATTL